MYYPCSFISHLDKIFLGIVEEVFVMNWINLDCEGCIYSDDDCCQCMLDKCVYEEGGSIEPPSSI